jgi:hypothetical protein
MVGAMDNIKKQLMLNLSDLLAKKGLITDREKIQIKIIISNK